MSLAFERFIGVDWSGAKGAYRGIAVAECGPGDNAPALVPPPDKRWRRSDFIDWLTSKAKSGKRILVGIDCAFALPRQYVEAFLGSDYLAFDLWNHVDQMCAGEDFYGGDFAKSGTHATGFWHSGKKPIGFEALHRATELICAQERLGNPESTLKLIGPKQVGKGGLAGMRVFAELKRRLGEEFAVWPFEPTERATVVCVEIFPRLFLQMALHGSGKVGIDELDACLSKLGCQSYMPLSESLTSDQTDALVAAAGLRNIASNREYWRLEGRDTSVLKTEGWIFGVP